MNKWIVTLEITVDAESREDALNKAFELTLGLPSAMLYDAEAVEQSGETRNEKCDY